MNQNGKKAIISVETNDLIENTVDTIFDADLDITLPMIEEMIEKLNPQEAGISYEPLKIALESLWEYFEGIRLIRTEGNFIEANERFSSAKIGFDEINYFELRDLSIAMEYYVAAVISIHSLNFGQYPIILDEIKTYLRKAGKYSRKFEFFIHHLEPEKFFVLASQAMITLDFVTAKPLVDQAFLTAKDVANEYYVKGGIDYNTFIGVAHMYKAIYSHASAQNNLNQFEFRKIVNEKNLEEDAIKAQNFLTKGDLGNIVIRNILNLSACLIYLLKTIRELAEIMQKVFSSTFKPDLYSLDDIKNNITIARDSASEAGSQAVPMIRSCNNLTNQVKNLELLARPNKKDFGKFSGLVSFALFLPLFLIVSWSNFTFEMGLDANLMIGSVFFLALIGGFGFGALRFKKWFFGLFIPDRSTSD
jgi:hypothetical protein